MPDVSENVAKSGTRTLERAGDFVSKFISSLLRYCEKNAKYAGYRAIGDWIKKKYNVEMFSARGDVADDVKRELKKRGIPYIMANASDLRSAFIIRDVDRETVEQINKDILIAKGNYYQAVDITSLNRAIGGADKIKDKTILQLDNLSKYEAITLQRKCNNIAKGFMVATDQMDDGTYSFAIHAPKAFTPLADPNKGDFCLAFNKMALSLWGSNSEIKHQQIDADISFDEKILQMRTSEATAYICSAQNKNMYLELNRDGFIYYDRTPAGEDIYKAQYYKNDASYLEELERHLDLMRDKVFCETEAEKLQVLNGTAENQYGERPVRTALQEEISLGETILAEGMDALIKEKFFDDAHFESLTWTEKIAEYQKETIKILEHFEKDGIIGIDGYDAEKLNALKQACMHHGIDFSELGACRECIAACKTHTYQSHVIKKDKRITEKQTLDKYNTR